MMLPPPPMKESAVAAVLVYWDIKRFPVPEGYDPREVRPCIKRNLRKLGYSGPITITAVGVLSKVPRGILKALFSSGISLHNGSHGFRSLLGLVFDCFIDNPPPANIMVISSPVSKVYDMLSYLKEDGYNTMFPFDASTDDAKSIWENSLLSGVCSSSLSQDTCTETVEPASWVCDVCEDITGPCFDNFIKHLSSPEHKSKLPLFFTPNSYVPMDRYVDEVVNAVAPRVSYLES